MDDINTLCTRIIALQQLLYLASQAALQRHPRGIAGHQRSHLVGKTAESEAYQPRILGLPFVTVGLDGSVLEVRLKVCGFMKKNPQKQVSAKVTVDRHLVELMPRLWPAVVAIFAAPSTGNMEVHLMAVKIIINPSYRLLRQVVAQYGTVSLLGGHGRLCIRR